MKYSLEKVLDPDEGIVHYSPPFGFDQVTLCGITDWIDTTPGEDTDKQVTCWSCKQMVKFIHEHRKPRGMDKW